MIAQTEISLLLVFLRLILVPTSAAGIWIAHVAIE